MKRATYFLIVFVMVVGLWAGSSTTGYAQTADPTPTPAAAAAPAAVLDPTSQVTFLTLGETDTLLRGPYDSLRVRLSTPIDWVLLPGATVQLDLSSSYTTLKGLDFTGTGASLEVTFNNVLVTTLPLDWTGERTLTIPLPPEALVSPRSDGRHELLLFLDAAIDCEYDHSTSLIVRQSSLINLPHDTTAPRLDLSRLPLPIYQDSAFQPVTAAVIVPDNPTAGELQAALTLAGGFGRLTNNRLPMTLLPAAAFTPEVQKANHIFMVGKADRLSALFTQLSLPAAFQGGAFAGVNPGEGVVQMAASPWSTANVVLVVSGDSDAAVNKAAQAVSSGVIRTNAAPNLAVVTDIQSSIAVPTIPVNRTLGELGYDVITLGGSGISSSEIRFYIPPGQITNNDAYVDISFTNSALVDFDRSGLVVQLNDQVIGSARISAETTTAGQARVTIPAYAVRPGINRMVFLADLLPIDVCTDINLNRLWLSISPNSMLHIPLVPAEPIITSLQNLGAYPLNFTASPTLKSVAFVLPTQDAAAWNTAVQLAADLGRRSYGTLVEVGAAFADALPEDFRKDRDLILVGVPADLPLIAELNPALPAPFENGSNIATERSQQVLYRLPDGVSLGYLQLAPAPWNNQRAVLGVLGSTSEGVAWAGNALVTAALRGQLGGDFAVVRDLQIISSDSRLSMRTADLSTTLVAPAEALVTPAPAVPVTTPAQNQPWLIPAIIATGVLIALVLIIAILSALRKKA